MLAQLHNDLDPASLRRGTSIHFRIHGSRITQSTCCFILLVDCLSVLEVSEGSVYSVRTKLSGRTKKIFEHSRKFSHDGVVERSVVCFFAHKNVSILESERQNSIVFVFS